MDGWDITLHDSGLIALVRYRGVLNARLNAYRGQTDSGSVAYLTLYDPDSRYTSGVAHLVGADGTCGCCRRFHGAWLDLALEAGWKCPALDAAVQSRSET